jgi:hypothetical protein
MEAEKFSSLRKVFYEFKLKKAINLHKMAAIQIYKVAKSSCKTSSHYIHPNFHEICKNKFESSLKSQTEQHLNLSSTEIYLVNN